MKNFGYCLKQFTLNLIYLLWHLKQAGKRRWKLKQLLNSIGIASDIGTIYDTDFDYVEDKFFRDWRPWMVNLAIKDFEDDCLTGDTQVVCLNDKKEYCLKRIDDLENFNGKVLSYNFLEKKYEFKEIANWWDKGTRDVYRHWIIGRRWFDATSDHKVYKWMRESNRFVVKTLNYISRLNRNARRIAIATEIPALNKISELDEDDMYVVGQYLSEGWREDAKGRIFISGDDVGSQNRLRNIFWKKKIRCSESKRRKHAYFSILKSQYRESFEKYGGNAFTKTIPDEILSLNKNKLSSLYESFVDGDGWRNSNILKSKDYGWCTSSDELNERLFLISLILGKPIGLSKQNNHQGFGNFPIWRAEHSKNSRINREDLPGVGKAGIRKKIQYLGKAPVYDIEVKDNHNFVLSTGVIVHNCDGYAAFAKWVARKKGWRAEYWSIYGEKSGKKWGHAVCLIWQGNVIFLMDTNGVRRFHSWKRHFPRATRRIKRWY